MDSNELIDVRYKGSKVSGVGKIEITLEVDDLDDPQASIKVLETRFDLNAKVSWFDVGAVGWYIRKENMARRKAKGG